MDAVPVVAQTVRLGFDGFEDELYGLEIFGG
jgi:hypothetical protein